jgi:hypothetical protein
MPSLGSELDCDMLYEEYNVSFLPPLFSTIFSSLLLDVSEKMICALKEGRSTAALND